MEQSSLENKTNICFVANFYKTILYHYIARGLEKNGISVYWIVLKKEQESFLINEYGHQKVLLINREYFNKSNAPVCDVKINEIVYGDRVLKHIKKQGINYLTNIQKPIYDFINKNQIRYIFGERTWSHEILISRLINQFPHLNCSYLSFTSIRIPGERFAFFQDEFESIILEPQSTEINNSNTDFTIEKPSYLAINDKFVKKNSSFLGRLNRIKRYFTNENIEIDDPNVIVEPFLRIQVTVQEELNRETYKLLKKHSFESIKDRKYIFLGFHKQPESSIDVLGRYFEDQGENVINFWRVLPPDWLIVIKEHTNAIGDRGYKFYKDLLKYPNIILIKETTDSHLLIKNSQLVCTVTGTIALEAALMGIPSITLSPTFFNRINYCRMLTWTDIQKYKNLEELITDIKSTPNNVEDYKKYIIQNSFEANTADIFSCPEVIEIENLKKIINAFFSVLKVNRN